MLWAIVGALLLLALAVTPDTPSRGRAKEKQRKTQRQLPPVERPEIALPAEVAIPQPPKVTVRRSKPKPSSELIVAIEAQREANCELGDAYRERSKRQTDPVKRAKDAKLSADAYARADKLQAQMDKLLTA